MRRLISAADWTYEALARAVNALGAENGVELRYDRTSVAHWLAGSLPRAPARAILSEAFSRRLGRPVSLADLGMGPAAPGGGEGAAQVPPGEAAPGDAEQVVTRLAALCGMDADPPRRELLRASLFSVAGLDVSAWQERIDQQRAAARQGHRQDHRQGPREDAPAADAAPEGAGDGVRDGVRDGAADGERAREAERMRAATEFFHRAGDLGGRYGRSALVTHLRDDVVPRLHNGARGSVRQELLGEAAHLVHVLALKYADDLQHGVAQHYFRTALQLAAEGGDPTAYAIVLRGMSAHALEVGHGGAALRIAVDAARTAPDGAPGHVRALLHVQLALAQAAAGDPREAADSLSTAERHHESVPEEPEEPEKSEESEKGAAERRGLCGAYVVSSFHFHRGRTLAALGDRTGALAALRRAWGTCPATSYCARALTQAEIARLSLRQGALEAACTAWHRFLDDYLHLDSGRADRALAQLRGELRTHRAHRSVRRLLHRADAAARRERRA
ncbi:hypothetical protein DVA86_33305 [Streptomyces armeniacus]|uniref:Transcriptional regulator n=1 Tax=Streptomyces armeniacus TaxID=83291 RepID=A0A345XYJ8_9ACTN|nr:hypothetical protein DVA86_33305 [Streptomyces armeniacus]